MRMRQKRTFLEEWHQTEWPKLKEQQPDLSSTEVVKTIAARWMALDDASKAPYEQEASRLKAQYYKDKAEFKRTHPDA